VASDFFRIFPHFLLSGVFFTPNFLSAQNFGVKNTPHPAQSATLSRKGHML
jgi:hypothetical protein